MRSKTEIAPVLTIAGSDCSGGAGVQADLKTFLANGVYGMSVITALKSQNTKGIQFVEIPSKESIASQLDAVFTDIPPRAVKIGMLPNADVCRLIAEKLVYYQAESIVVDPVMIASSGARLSDESVARAMEEVLFPLATVITPNRMEAEQLSGKKITSWEEMQEVAAYLSDKYDTAVLLKGGHFGDTATDLLHTRDAASVSLEKPRLHTRHTHGTGCTYSSAICANLGKGMGLASAVSAAKDWLHDVLLAGTPVQVEENGPLHHGALL